MPPARWKTWYPHSIDAWRGSMSVQSMSDGAYRGYHQLLMSQWESEDGKLPIDEKMLARLSGLGKRWPQFRDEIMEHFTVDNNRCFNDRQMREWLKAMEVSERKGRKHPESGQSVDGVCTESDMSVARVRTHARVIVPVDVSVINQESISPDEVSRAVLCELCLSGDKLQRNLYEVTRAEMAKGRDAPELRDAMIIAWREYEKAKLRGELDCPRGAEKFFGEGLWRDPRLWQKKKQANGAFDMQAWLAAHPD